MASDIFNTGQTNVNNAAGSGSSAIGSFDPNAWNSSTQSGLNNITSSQAAGNQGLVDAFKTQISSQPSATDYYNQGRNLFNVQGLQDTSNNLNSAMLNTPNSNLASAKGFNFDENQVQQKNSQDLQRLAPAATAAQGYANTAQGNAISFANNGIQQNQMNLIPLTAAQQMQSDLYARQQSGFSQTSQATLASLQAKMTQGVSLSNQEMASYSQLTAAEASYQGSLATANATVKSAQTTAQNQILPSSNGTSTYYNPVTGQAYNPFATPAKPT
jgi:hypothetical protein